MFECRSSILKTRAVQAGSAWGGQSASQTGPSQSALPQPSDGQQQPQQQQQRQQVDAENAALQQQLLALGGEVAAVERSVRDVAALNQMFSAQVSGRLTVFVRV